MKEAISIYNEFSTLTLVIIWVLVFFFFFLIVYICKLVKKNKALEELVKDVTRENDELSKTIKLSEMELKSIKKKALEVNKNQVSPEKKKDPVEKREEKEKKKPTLASSEQHLSSNNLKVNSTDKIPSHPSTTKLNSRTQTSSVYLNESQKKKTNSVATNHKEQKLEKKNIHPISAPSEKPLNLNDFIKKEHNKEVKVEEDKETDVISVKQLSSGEKTKLEAFKYEKKQEDDAIISYQEFLKVKDKLYEEADDDEDLNFINDLKLFRENLEKSVNS